MVRIMTETNHEQVNIHFSQEDIEISIRNLTECKTVSINFGPDLNIFLTPDQADGLSDLLGQSTREWRQELKTQKG